MHAVILAGGFAKRMWPLTREVPKPLLQVAGRPVIEYILEKLAGIDSVERIFITVNSRFAPLFDEWLANSGFAARASIVTEPAKAEEHKLGAIGALGHLLRNENISGDLMVIAGDNLFDFDVGKFIETAEDSPQVALFDMDKEKIGGKYGVVVLDENKVIRAFHEKPQEPPSTLISTGCYFFPKSVTGMIHRYLAEGNNADAPGFFISWLARQMAVQGFVFDGDSRWFDIGSIESYREARKAYGEK
jgi:glucose-1-phosphate thymidylyltransferase